jgi:hypothetical protein
MLPKSQEFEWMLPKSQEFDWMKLHKVLNVDQTRSTPKTERQR